MQFSLTRPDKTRKKHMLEHMNIVSIFKPLKIIIGKIDFIILKTGRIKIYHIIFVAIFASSDLSVLSKKTCP